MGLIYLGCSILLALFTTWDAKQNKNGLWWGGVTLIFAPAALVYQIRNGGKNKRVLAAACGVLFCLCLGGEVLFYFQAKKARASKPTIPPLVKSLLELNGAVKQTTIDIYKASERLDSLGMVQSRITDVKSTLDTIAKIRALEAENNAAIERLLEFSHEHETLFRRNHLDWLFAIRTFYRDDIVVQHQQSRSNYLMAFENLLAYSYKNFVNINEKHSVPHQKTYDAYYMRYRQAADRHNRFNRKRVAYQSQFIKQHPEVAPFLPGAHQMESFKFWDRFSF